MRYKNLPFKLLFVFTLAFQLTVVAQLTPQEAIGHMRKGINMGNTLEPPQEGEWGNPAPQEYLFDMYKDAGFDFVRIPVRWDMHLGTTSPYTINEAWLKHIEQIVDWGLTRGLYIVLNSHHDSWIKDNYDNPINQARFDSLWSQVANRFKNRSEKLIFEICNEPQGAMTKVQNDDMHQKAINIIRKTNPTRLIIFQGIDWGGSDALINAAIPPNDPYLIGSFHSYDPWPFGLEGTGTFTSTDAINLRAKFQKVKDWSVKNNIPVFLGEFGGTSKCEYNARMRQYKTYMELAETFGFAPCAWEDGGEFKIINRIPKTWFDDLKDILTQSSNLSPKALKLAIVQDTIIKLDWTNAAADYDSISIERRTATTVFKRVASLKGNINTFSEYHLLGNKDYYYRVIAHCPNQMVLYSYPQKVLLPPYVPKVPQPRVYFTGQPMPIPGKIEAENFDIGEEGLTYHDTDTKNITGNYRPNEPVDLSDLGNNVIYVIDNFPGEWLEYTVNVAQKGDYTITIPIAAFPGGGTFKIKIGNTESEILKAPASNSWIKTKPLSAAMSLEAGIQVMRISFIDKPLFYIDYLDFARNIPSGISSKNVNDPFTVYQHQQELIIQTANNSDFETVKIFNILGSCVKDIPVTESTLKVTTNGMNPGVYVVQLINTNQRISKKVIIR